MIKLNLPKRSMETIEALSRSDWEKLVLQGLAEKKVIGRVTKYTLKGDA